MQLHPLTETHPVMSVEQYEAFKLDIAKNGQLQPVIMYRGKIVDGRHRLRALKELGVAQVVATSLSNNLTLQEVEAKVVSTEKRRHQSPTQLAIRGYRLYKGGVKQPEAVVATGCSLSNLKLVAALEKLGRLDLIEVLEQGGKVDIGVAGYSKYTDSLLGVVQWVKGKRKEADEFMARLEGGEEASEGEAVNAGKVLAVGTLLDGWSDKELDMLVAVIYERKNNG